MTAVAEIVGAPSGRAFVLRKLHSLSGVIPLGVFLLEHLWTNAKALQGQAAFERAVLDIQALPFLPVIEIAGIFVPLAFHAFFGVYLALSSNPNTLRYTYARNWLYLLQRATGILALLFIGWHLYEYRIQKWLFGMSAESFYDTLAAHLSATVLGLPLLAVVYLLGVAATVFHFANGLWGFCVSWGLTVTRTAQRRAGYAFGAVGVLLFLLGANTVLYFATGSRVLLPNDFEPFRGEVGSGPCPPPAPTHS